MSERAAVYRVEQVRALERHAIDVLGVPGFTLMKRAAAAALAELQRRWPKARRLAIVCGGGNNGGDGLALALAARRAGLESRVFLVADANALKGEAAEAWREWQAAGGEAEQFTGGPAGGARQPPPLDLSYSQGQAPMSPQDRAPRSAQQGILAGADVVVDALLGIGARGAPRGALAGAILAINAADLPVLALDVPSGLDADSGIATGAVVRADATLTFIARKCGLYLGNGSDVVGAIHCDDLGLALDDAAIARVAGAPAFELLAAIELAGCLPSRPAGANKGDFGRVLIIGGGRGMPGAARLAGEACLRLGAGRVTVACDASSVAAIAGERPELMCHAVREAKELEALCKVADVIALGPGLGQDEWAETMARVAVAAGRRLVVDADALNLLAARRIVVPPGAIHTPHPGEAARLLGVSADDVQGDRLGALQSLLRKTEGVVVLKGAGSLVGVEGRTPALCPHGNPGMATAGMGDVLTGAIAALWAQGSEAWLAACHGVLLHALAGDALAARMGRRGLLALELATEMPVVLKGYCP